MMLQELEAHALEGGARSFSNASARR